MKVLTIESLQHGIPVITNGFFALYKEKCMVAFNNQNHNSGVELSVKTDLVKEFVSIKWKGEITPQLIDSHADSKKTTEDAACAIALLLIKEYTEYTAYKTTDTNGERVDYYLRSQDEEADDTLIFNNTAYLEVSGINKETRTNSLQKRLNNKLKRLNSSSIIDGDDLVFTCIVEFSKPASVLVTS